MNWKIFFVVMLMTLVPIVSACTDPNLGYPEVNPSNPAEGETFTIKCIIYGYHNQLKAFVNDDEKTVETCTYSYKTLELDGRYSYVFICNGLPKGEYKAICKALAEGDMCQSETHRRFDVGFGPSCGHLNERVCNDKIDHSGLYGCFDYLSQCSDGICRYSCDDQNLCNGCITANCGDESDNVNSAGYYCVCEDPVCVDGNPIGYRRCYGSQVRKDPEKCEQCIYSLDFSPRSDSATGLEKTWYINVYDGSSSGCGDQITYNVYIERSTDCYDVIAQNSVVVSRGSGTTYTLYARTGEGKICTVRLRFSKGDRTFEAGPFILQGPSQPQCTYNAYLSPSSDTKEGDSYTWNVALHDTSSNCGTITYTINSHSSGCSHASVSPTSISMAEGGTATFTVSASAPQGGTCVVYVDVISPSGLVTSGVYTLTGSTPPQMGEIRGVVRDSHSSPIYGATVTCNSRSTTTDTYGRYHISNIPSGNYVCTASKSGYSSETRSVYVPSGQTVTVDFTLVEQHVCTDEYICVGDDVYHQLVDCTRVFVQHCEYGCSNGQCLQPQNGMLYGNVYDDEGSAVNGATVQCDGYIASSNSWGYYSMELPPGYYTCRASKQGYSDDVKSFYVSIDGTRVDFTLVRQNICTDEYICVGDDVYHQLVDCTRVFVQHCEYGCSNGQCLQPQNGRVRGHVYDTKGDAINGAVVQCSGYTDSTDLWGYYSIDLPSGNYVCTASKSGYSSETRSVYVPSGQSVTVDFTLVEQHVCTDEYICVGDDVYHQLVDCTRVFVQHCEYGCSNGQCNPGPTRGTVRGHVYDEEGSAISGALVACDGYSDSSNLWGYYSIELPRGYYTCTASKSGYSSETRSVYVPSGQSVTVDFTLRSEERCADEYICIGNSVYHQFSDCTKVFVQYCAHGCENGHCITPRRGLLKGHVYDNTGRKVISAEIRCDSYKTYTNWDGYYTMSIPSGLYTCVASKNGYEPDSINVYIEDGKEKTADFVLKKIKTNPPSLTIWHSPTTPTTTDVVNIYARAIDDRGIRYIKIYINGHLSKTCYSSTCNAARTYHSPGWVRYYAVTEDVEGNKITSDTKSFYVRKVGGGEIPTGGITVRPTVIGRPVEVIKKCTLWECWKWILIAILILILLILLILSAIGFDEKKKKRRR